MVAARAAGLGCRPFGPSAGLCPPRVLSKAGSKARRVREDPGDLGGSGEGSEALMLDCAGDTRTGASQETE